MTSYAFGKYDIQTHSGQRHYLDRLSENGYLAQDICGAGAHICRYGGHCKFHYSINHHSYLASLLAPPELRLPMLLHDVHEIYSGFGDMMRPMKLYLSEKFPEFAEFIKQRENEIDKCVARAFDFDVDLFYADEVKEIDMRMWATELHQVCNPSPYFCVQFADFEPYDIRIHEMAPHHVESLFRTQLYALTEIR